MNFNGISQIGIVGGGVSALMMCIEAAKLGIRTTLLDPKVNCVGSQIATEHIVATITNESIQKLSLRVDTLIFNTKLDFELNTKLHAKTFPTKETMKELCNYRNVLELLELLEVPTPKTYYQDNKADTFSTIENLALPFRFIKQYPDHTETLEVRTHEDIADFILEMDEIAEGFMLQPITEYKHVITFLCMVDEQGKVVLYEPLEESYENSKVCTLEMANSLSKTMIQRLSRFNRKILKELNAIGVFTIKYGIKANKSVECIEVTPEVTMAGLLTLEAYDVSVYEQYMHLLLGLKINTPVLESIVHGTVKALQEPVAKEGPCHLYNLGLTNLCITKVKEKNEE